MNDELSGMLASRNWQLPEYAVECLWLDTGEETVQVEGERGLFELNSPAQLLTVRWGHAAGPMLAQLNWQPDCLEWDGTVRIGGMIDALHLAEPPGVHVHVALVHFTGRPLLKAAAPYPDASFRRTALYTPPDFLDSIPDGLEDTTTTWLVGDDSPLLSLVQDAIARESRVWFSGRLAEDDSGWEQFFALPLLLEAVTLFADL